MATLMSLTDFKLFLIRKGISNKTAKLYCNAVKRFFSEHETFTQESLDSYVVGLLDREGSKNAINTYISGYRNYAEFTNNHDLLEYKYFKPQRCNVSVFSVDELKKFLELECPSRARPNVWKTYQAFFKLLAYTGARPNEIASLTKNNVDLGRSVFTLPTSKTNSPRNIPIPEPCRKDVLDRFEAAITYLFHNKDGNKINDHNWSFHFHNRLKLLGLNRKGLTCYSLRHSFITHMLEEDVNVFKVKKIVGHKSFQTTERYTHLTTKDIVEAVKKHPLVKKARSPDEKKEAWLVVTQELLGDDFYINQEQLVKGLKKKQYAP
jgi:integrase/recombinase XerD